MRRERETASVSVLTWPEMSRRTQVTTPSATETLTGEPFLRLISSTNSSEVSISFKDLVKKNVDG